MNWPNVLSGLRIVMVPVFAAVFFSGRPDANRIAAGIFIAAALTDVLDGFLARRFHLVTRLGRFLDPLADKLMMFTALLCIGLGGRLPVWIAWVYFMKEAVMAAGGLALYRRTRDVPPSNRIGKAAAVVLVVAIAFVILFENVPYYVKMGIVLAALVLTLTALAVYTARAVRLYGKPKQ